MSKLRYINLSLALLSMAIVSFSQGLVITIVSLRVDTASVAPITSITYLGGLIGALKTPWLIKRCSSTFLYILMTILLSFSSLALVFSENMYFWYVMRFLFGAGNAMFFILIDFLMLSVSDNKSRARMVAYSGMAFYAFYSLAQKCLPYIDMYSNSPFYISTALGIFGLVPLYFSEVKNFRSGVKEVKWSRIIDCFKIAPSSIVFAFVQGLLYACVTGLLPKHFEELGFTDANNTSLIAVVMSAALFFRYPVCHFSDVFGRRVTLLLASALSLMMCGAAVFVLNQPQISILSLAISLQI